MPAGSQAVIWQGALPRRRGILRYRPATVAPLGSRHLRREPMKPTWTQGTQGWIGLALTLMLGACRSPPASTNTRGQDRSHGGWGQAGPGVSRRSGVTEPVSEPYPAHPRQREGSAALASQCGSRQHLIGDRDDRRRWQQPFAVYGYLYTPAPVPIAQAAVSESNLAKKG